MRVSFAYAAAFVSLVSLVLLDSACSKTAPSPSSPSPAQEQRGARLAQKPVEPKPIEPRPSRSGAELRAPTDSEVAAIRDALAPRVNECFAKWTSTQPQAPAHCAFDLAYDPQGILSAVSVAPSEAKETAAPPETIACLREAIAGTRVPATGARIALRLPFELTPLPAKPPLPKQKTK